MDALAQAQASRFELIESSIAEQILIRGFAEMYVDPAILSEHLPVILEGMRRMTDAHNETPFPNRVACIDNVGWKMEAGLYRRTGQDASRNTEEKFFFHHVPGVEWPSEEAAPYARFIAACDAISAEAKKIALRIAEEIDEIHAHVHPEFPSLYMAIKESTAVTRPLRYLFATEAYPHFDRSAISVQWYATEEGLVIVDKYGKHHRVEEKAWDRVAIFYGKKFAGLFAGDPSKYPQGRYGYGTLHGTKKRSGSRPPLSLDRYSLVTFVHAKLTSEAAAWINANDQAMNALEKQCAL